MLFGEFLIEKKLITEQQLLEALVAQVRETPTLLEMVLELKLIESSELLKIVTTQFSRKIEFQAACREHGQWSNDLAVRLEQETLKRRRPIGEFLLGKKFISIDDLNRILDEYVAHRAKEHSTMNGQVPGSVLRDSGVVPGSGPVKAVEQPKPVPGDTPGVVIDRALLTEFFKIVSPERLGDIRARLEGAQKSPETAKSASHEAVNLVYGIKSAAKFVGAQTTATIAEHLVKVIRSLESQFGTDSARPEGPVWQVIWDGLKYTGQLADCLRNSQSEDGFWNEPEIALRAREWLDARVNSGVGEEGLRKKAS